MLLVLYSKFILVYLNGEVLLAVHVLHAVGAVDAVQFFDRLFLVGADLLDEVDGRVVNVLLRSSDRLFAATERVHLSVERGDLRLTTLSHSYILYILKQYYIQTRSYKARSHQISLNSTGPWYTSHLPEPNGFRFL